MLHEWSTMTFLHWPYRPSLVQRLLPPSLEVESVDGQAWVGLLPFRMRDVRIPVRAQAVNATLRLVLRMVS
jgi:uncharacterized protein YqjF (DUF2071 family)